MPPKETARLPRQRDRATINTPTEGMDTIIMATTPLICNDRLAKMSLSTQRPRGLRANDVVAANLRDALAKAHRGPKWVAKQLGLNKRRATMLVNGETVIFVADLTVLADALNMPASRFFEGV